MTAAHCLYDDDKEEVLPASSFSVMLGLHDRGQAKELNRFKLFPHDLLIALVCYICIICTRRQIRVNKVIVHENFTDSANDIAILRLGKKDQ